MIALDTNVVVRVIMDDDPPAAARARRLLSEGDVFLGVTVLLETAWVLGRRYGLPPKVVTQALRGFAGLPGVAIESSQEVGRALRWVDEGMQFPDALHLALSAPSHRFATFDRKLLRKARARDLAVVEP